MKDYEEAVAVFETADAHYKALEERFLSGDWVDDCGSSGLAVMKEVFKGKVQEIQDALEERNVRLRNAADLLRQQVVLSANKWRGPEGKASFLDAGRFKVSSVTSRSFDQRSLFDLCQKHGLLERLLELKMVDKDGVEKPIVKQEYDIDYDAVYQWLKANKLNDIIDGAYDEKEKTPQVKGPKPLAFLGEQKDK